MIIVKTICSFKDKLLRTLSFSKISYFFGFLIRLEFNRGDYPELSLLIDDVKITVDTIKTLVSEMDLLN